ncbi:hypothetical protein HUS90_34310, partial [Pseudomonas protegens]|nr:hypothetical protein [Pseudomonas protegens]
INNYSSSAPAPLPQQHIQLITHLGPIRINPLLTRQKDIYLEAGNHHNLVHMSMAQYLKLVPHAEVCEVSH